MMSTAQQPQEQTHSVNPYVNYRLQLEQLYKAVANSQLHYIGCVRATSGASSAGTGTVASSVVPDFTDAVVTMTAPDTAVNVTEELYLSPVPVRIPATDEGGFGMRGIQASFDLSVSDGERALIVESQFGRSNAQVRIKSAMCCLLWKNFDRNVSTASCILPALFVRMW
jgi:hypothetical protein